MKGEKYEYPHYSRWVPRSKKVLEKDDLFTTSRAYASYERCIGTNVELNGIYEENRKVAEK